jgi:periplasmic protein TonB
VNKQSISSVTERPANIRRITTATLLATAAWAFFLTHSQWLFSWGEPIARRPEPIDVRLVEWPQPQSQQVAAPDGASAKMQQTTARPVVRPATRPARTVKRQPDVVRPSAPKLDIAPPPPPRTPEAVQQTPSTASARPAQTADTQPASSESSPSATQQSAASHADAPTGGPARVVAQPLPELPDDLREEGYQLVAVARFLIHVDGTFDVELIKPTSIPRLNQILIATLHQWRFAPATESGHPVESRQDVRVHFNVN